MINFRNIYHLSGYVQYKEENNITSHKRHIFKHMIVQYFEFNDKYLQDSFVFCCKLSPGINRIMLVYAHKALALKTKCKALLITSFHFKVVVYLGDLRITSLHMLHCGISKESKRHNILHVAVYLGFLRMTSF